MRWKREGEKGREREGEKWRERERDMERYGEKWRERVHLTSLYMCVSMHVFYRNHHNNVMTQTSSYCNMTNVSHTHC